MRQVTLGFLVKDDSLLLAMKKRGFGVNKWNGVGGKLAPGETPAQAMIRECKEEIGVTIDSSALEQVGVIDFHFDGKPDWDQQCLIYCARTWSGDPIESEEMKPQWYQFDEIPYESMWIDDIHWLPHVLMGKKIKGEFTFNNDGSKIVKQRIEEVADFM